jgi:hypothetical protein
MIDNRNFHDYNKTIHVMKNIEAVYHVTAEHSMAVQPFRCALKGAKTPAVRTRV